MCLETAPHKRGARSERFPIHSFNSLRKKWDYAINHNRWFYYFFFVQLFFSDTALFRTNLWLERDLGEWSVRLALLVRGLGPGRRSLSLRRRRSDRRVEWEWLGAALGWNFRHRTAFLVLSELPQDDPHVWVQVVRGRLVVPAGRVVAALVDSV
jgi:hypothetical protein